MIEPLRVGDRPRISSDGVRRQLIENHTCLAPLDEELGHERHIHQTDTLANGAVLGFPVWPPVLTPPGKFVDFWRNPDRGEPVGAFPAAHVAEIGPLFDKAIVDR